MDSIRRRLTEAYNASGWVRLAVVVATVAVNLLAVSAIERIDCSTWVLCVLTLAWMLLLATVVTWLVHWYPPYPSSLR
jgi:hypothetical protein